MDASLLTLLDIVVLMLLASLGACTWWLVVRSLPQALIERQKRVETLVEQFRTEVQSIGAERAEQRVQGERLAEEVSTYLEQIERKRSSTAASASRIAGVQNQRPPDLASMTRADQIAHLRRMSGG